MFDIIELTKQPSEVSLNFWICFDFLGLIVHFKYNFVDIYRANVFTLQSFACNADPVPDFIVVSGDFFTCFFSYICSIIVYPINKFS